MAELLERYSRDGLPARKSRANFHSRNATLESRADRGYLRSRYADRFFAALLLQISTLLTHTDCQTGDFIPSGQ
jgi:hypothetical protein